ncbi:NAD-dependent epimerase/dehydratase family protein [uncultured Flavobacterium sp.]|uniref:NAD-dependent epimerase/dehydratase family protein n=1 Tax=uncultured Flavobacterium sp. TaxID=165435 RepID=UPI0025DCE59E|nr:NAD-dependent epimerase/dehydratase family protein [uncultured Flavobacterium sp.]
MILVTGATGLVGSHLLLQLLENGEEVRALYRNHKNIQKTKAFFHWKNQSDLFEKINWIQGCITDVPSLEEVFKNIDYVYHCAALISFDPNDEEKLRKINIEGTANIVNFSLANKVKKLCYVSSIAALGDLQEHETIITEETDWNPEKPHSDYAITKYGAEMEVWRGQEEGLDTIVVNPGVILGPGFWQNGSSEIFRRIKKGLKFYTKGASGFISVEEVVKTMYFLMKSDIKKERFTLVEKNYSYQELSNKIADALQVKRPNMPVKPWMTNLAWRIDWLFSPLFFRKRKLSRAMAKSMHTETLFDNSKIKKACNIEFASLDEYIKKVSSTY